MTGGLLLIGTWLALNLDETPTGRAFRALHDSEVAAQVVGIDVARFKLQAFVDRRRLCLACGFRCSR